MKIEIENENLEKRKKFEQYVFVYQILAQSTKYQPDEFEVAKDAMQLILGHILPLKAEIEASLPKPPAEPEEDRTTTFSVE